MNRTLWMPVVAVFVLLFAIQLVPYRVENPPVTGEPAWDSPTTEALARKACFDCHSNQVRVPWYGHIAPASWLVTQHVNEGRGILTGMSRCGEELDALMHALDGGYIRPAYGADPVRAGAAALPSGPASTGRASSCSGKPLPSSPPKVSSPQQ